MKNDVITKITTKAEYTAYFKSMRGKIEHRAYNYTHYTFEDTEKNMRRFYDDRDASKFIHNIICHDNGSVTVFWDEVL